MTIPSRSVNTTTALLLLDDVFVSQVDDEDIEKQEQHSFFICTISVPYQCYITKKKYCVGYMKKENEYLMLDERDYCASM